MNPEHVNLLKQGVQWWNEWRNSTPSTSPDLSTADLSRADLSGANLSRADLRWADLRWADLREANLPGADLRGADLREANIQGAADLRWADLCGADLRGADLQGTDLSEADLREANLQGADLRSADLRGVDLRKANLQGTDLNGVCLNDTVIADVDLSRVGGLDDCVHLGPSILDHRTLQRSGRLPLVFLRGCGLPDKLIDYLPALFNEPIQFYSCFISFSIKDQEFADRLHADLQNKGVRCWFARHNIAGGKKIHEQIDQAIRLHERLLLILSPASMASEWVKTEIAKARKREVREQRRVLFPIRLVEFETLRDWECFDADTGKDSAREIREYFIPDFSRWKDHDAYQQAFDRLLRDLKKAAESAAVAKAEGNRNSRD